MRNELDFADSSSDEGSTGSEMDFDPKF